MLLTGICLQLLCLSCFPVQATPQDAAESVPRRELLERCLKVIESSELQLRSHAGGVTSSEIVSVVVLMDGREDRLHAGTPRRYPSEC